MRSYDEFGWVNTNPGGITKDGFPIKDWGLPNSNALHIFEYIRYAIKNELDVASPSAIFTQGIPLQIATIGGEHHFGILKYKNQNIRVMFMPSQAVVNGNAFKMKWRGPYDTSGSWPVQRTETYTNIFGKEKTRTYTELTPINWTKAQFAGGFFEIYFDRDSPVSSDFSKYIFGY